MASVGWPYLSMIFYDRAGFRQKWTDEQILNFIKHFPETVKLSYLSKDMYSLKLKGFGKMNLIFTIQESYLAEEVKTRDYPCFSVRFDGNFFNILENTNPPLHTPIQGRIFTDLFLHLAQYFDCDYGAIAMEGWLSTPTELSEEHSSNASNFFINTKTLSASDYQHLACFPSLTSEHTGHILYLSQCQLYFPKKVAISYPYNAAEDQIFTQKLERLLRRKFQPVLP